MGERIVVIGAGGHAGVVAEAAASGGREVVGHLDRSWDPARPAWRAGRPVIGPDEAFEEHLADAAFAVGIGDAAARRVWIERLEAAGARLPALVHAAAWKSPTASIGPGTVVLSNASVCAGSVLGRGVIVNTNASVDHDCVVGDWAHVCPGANLAGEVRVGEAAWIGLGASVLPGVTIGDRATVGSGAVCVSDVVEGATVVGVPARPR